MKFKKPNEYCWCAELVRPFATAVLLACTALLLTACGSKSGPAPAQVLRQPKAGDLRYLLFSQVNLPGLLDQGSPGNIFAGAGGFDNAKIKNAVGSPLGIGSSYICGDGTCAWPWGYQLLPPPMTGLDMYYEDGEYSSFISDLQTFAASDIVFTSLDLEPPDNVYAVSWVQTTSTGGFDYRLEPVVPPGAGQQAQIQAQAILDGAESRIITAASFDAQGNAVLISYGWTGDTTTEYDTQTNIVTHDEVCSTATSMAGGGYIISAFGGNDSDGYMLIGMRVQGDTLPRPIEGVTPTGPPYYTTVVYLRASGNICVINEQ
jgi:hypothetical protein